MSVVWRIAFRNLQEHRTKSLIVGTIILIGTFVLVVGNSLMDSAAAGIRRSFIDNFTGHLVLAGVTDAPVNLFGVRSTELLNTLMPRIDGYDQLLQTVVDHPDVAAWSPLATGAVMIGLAIGDGLAVGEDYEQLWGIDPARFRAAFPEAAELIAGSFPAPDQAGVVLLERQAKYFAEVAGREVEPGDRVLITATTGAGIKVREVPVTGIFRFRNVLPQLNFISLVDITTLHPDRHDAVGAGGADPDRRSDGAARRGRRGRPVRRRRYRQSDSGGGGRLGRAGPDRLGRARGDRGRLRRLELSGNQALSPARDRRQHGRNTSTSVMMGCVKS